MSELKKCRTCFAEKPISEFYRQTASGNPFGDCRDCFRKAVRRRYQGRGPIAVFETQRASAVNRGIRWQLTFDEWWGIWVASGKWGKRGIRKGQYVMARHGDVGPYAVGNVKIITTEENIGERGKHAPIIKNLPEIRLA